MLLLNEELARARMRDAEAVAARVARPDLAFAARARRGRAVAALSSGGGEAGLPAFDDAAVGGVGVQLAEHADRTERHPMDQQV